MKKNIFLTILACIAVLTVSCSKENEFLIGKWRVINNQTTITNENTNEETHQSDSSHPVYEFRENGEFLMSPYLYRVGSYSIDGNTLTISYDEKTTIYNVFTLTLTELVIESTTTEQGNRYVTTINLSKECLPFNYY